MQVGDRVRCEIHDKEWLIHKIYGESVEIIQPNKPYGKGKRHIVPANSLSPIQTKELADA